MPAADAEGHQHWRTDVLVPLLEEHRARTTFVVGCAEEQASLHGRFRAIVERLLEIAGPS